jgi:hypothetical protein
MKDIILGIKSKALALDSEVEFEQLENKLIELKKQIKLLDIMLDLKMLD